MQIVMKVNHKVWFCLQDFWDENIGVIVDFQDLCLYVICYICLLLFSVMASTFFSPQEQQQMLAVDAGK